MNKVYLSIGSNLGSRKSNIRKSFAGISEFAQINACSKVYRTKPYGPVAQPDFINMAIEISTGLDAETLLDKLQELEKDLGRIRTIHWGPRTIDLDILFFNDLIYQSPRLVIPHPDLQNRLFVLKPMADIAPGLIHPVLKKSIENLIELAFQNKL